MLKNCTFRTHGLLNQIQRHLSVLNMMCALCWKHSLCLFVIYVTRSPNCRSTSRGVGSSGQDTQSMAVFLIKSRISLFTQEAFWQEIFFDRKSSFFKGGIYFTSFNTAISWVTSPLLSGVIAIILYKIVLKTVVEKVRASLNTL